MMPRLISGLWLLVPILLTGCTEKPVPHALVGEWVCDLSTTLTFSLDEINYASSGEFVVQQYDGQKEFKGKFYVDGDKISYGFFVPAAVIKSLPTTFSEVSDRNMRFEFHNSKDLDPKTGICRRKN